VHGRRSDRGSRGDDEVRARMHGQPPFIGVRTPRSPGRARPGGAATGVATSASSQWASRGPGGWAVRGWVEAGRAYGLDPVGYSFVFFRNYF
jgi:hypothetical protein